MHCLNIRRVWKHPVREYGGIKYLNLICIASVTAFLLSGCTPSVIVAGSVPTPLVERIPVHVGVYYPEGFQNYVHKEVLPEAGTYRINLGEQNLSFFRNLVTALFEDVTELNSTELTEAQAAEIDIVLVPEIIKYGFLVPAISTLTFYEASIEYGIQITDTNGDKLGSWNIVGYGKAEASVFGGGDAVGEATMLAIRDGGARIATEVSPKIAMRLSGESASQEGSQ